MPNRTLTINNADGSSETYTINRDAFEGVRSMTREYVYPKTFASSSTGSGVTYNKIDEQTFSIVASNSTTNRFINFITAEDGLRVGRNRISFDLLLNSGSVSTLNGLYTDKDSDPSNGGSFGNYSPTSGSNSLEVEIFDDGSGQSPRFMWTVKTGSTFDISVTNFKITYLDDPITVDRTPAPDVRTLTADGQVITIDTTKTGVRTLTIDGSEITIDRSDELGSTNLVLTEAEYEALTEYEDRTYTVSGVGTYQGAAVVDKEAWTYGPNDVHVTKSGHDFLAFLGSPAGSIDRPFLTISAAYNHVASTLNGGTIWVHEGTYAENTGNGYFLKGATNPTNRLYIKGRPDQNVTMTNVSGSYVLRFNGASSNITFQNIEFKAVSNVTNFLHSSGGSAQLNDFEFIECHFNDDQVTTTSLSFSATSLFNNNVAVKRCTFTSDGNMSTLFKRCVNLKFIGNTFNCPNASASFKAVRILTGCSGDIHVNNNTITVNAGDFVSQENAFTLATKLYVLNNIVVGVTSEGILVEGGTSGVDCEVYLNNNDITSTDFGIRVQQYVTKGEAKNNKITSSGAVPFGFPTDSADTGVVKDVIISDNEIYATGSGGHALLVSSNSQNISVLNNTSDASSGGSYALVLKGDGHTVTGNTFVGGYVNAMYIKGSSNSTVTSNTVTQNISSTNGTLSFSADAGSGLVSTNNTITGNTFNVSNNAKLHGWSASDISTGNVVDSNTYNITGTGEWGSMFNAAEFSLADVRDSWATNYDVTTNDSNSN